MNTDPFGAYQEALKALAQRTREVEAQIAVVVDGANKLRANWRDVDVSNGRPALTFPSGRSMSIAADRWPTGQEVGEFLVSWHKANQAVNHAWQSIPRESRGMLKPPQFDLYGDKTNG